MNKIQGTGVALITPFQKDKTIDYKGLEKLIYYVIKGGVDYIVLMGTTGENTALTLQEKTEIINFCKKTIKNKLPIVLGIGGNNTLKIIEEIKNTSFNGISAILSVSPYYNKPSQSGIYDHYKLISEHSPLPIIMYNVPSRTGNNILAKTTISLANDCNNIIGIKEASGDINQIMKIINEKPKNFMVISGDDNLTLPMIYLGAKGVISVIGQLYPKEYSKMVNYALKRNILQANKLHYNLYKYYEPLYEEGNPTGIKAALEIIGICKKHVRAPLTHASNKIIRKLKNLTIQ